MVEKIADILENKKAKDIRIINIEDISVLTDYFIICSGTSSTHIRALADELEFKMEEAGCRHLRREGYDSARWILFDYGNVVVHIFHEDDRNFYDLERLWSDGKIYQRQQSKL